MKILLLGAKGMLGSAFVSFTASQPHSLTAIDKDQLDITKHSELFSVIKKLKPTVVINCAAYTDVDCAEENQELAMKVNGKAVGFLAEACQKTSALLIHFSTDYVFAGSNAQGYKEDDKPSPLNIYGQSKFLGERLISQFLNFSISGCCKYFLIRTSWLYGPNGKNFVNTMLKLAQEKDEIKVVDDQSGRPTYTFDLAERVLWMIENRDKLKSGIYHCTNSLTALQPYSFTASQSATTVFKRRLLGCQAVGLTWYSFAQEIFQQAKICGLIKKEPKVIPCDSSEFHGLAKRPHYSILINTKLPEMRTWQEGLKEYLE